MVVRTGDPGVAAVVPDDLPVSNCSDLVVVRPGPDLDSRYLAYFFNGAARGYVDSRTVGAVQQHFNVREARELQIPTLALARQRAIAEVLGALDDKIAANRRAAALAQDLADTRFAVWRGSVAATSAATTFGDLAQVHGGSTPKTVVAEYWNGDHAWAVPRDVTRLESPYLFNTERRITDAGLASIGNRLHPAGSIFMTSRATIGAFAVPQLPCAANQGFIVVVPTVPSSRWFLFHEMRSRVDEMLDLANGSTFLEISRGNFRKMRTIHPSQVDLKQLDALLAPLHAWCASVDVESSRLAAMRDVLLPRLLAGALQVREAQALVEEAV